uniref:COP1 E3 ubiquitin ligase n=1 Tax=Astyanax mexicanus TaxID=7994 RepID=A0A8B9J6X3_ASTMX
SGAAAIYCQWKERERTSGPDSAISHSENSCFGLFYLIILFKNDFHFLFFSPICFEMIEEAHMTKCGHSFCYKCIRQSLEDSNRCPKCNYIIDNVDQLYPNFLVNELILKQKQRCEEKRLKRDHPNGTKWQFFQDVLGTDQENLDLANVNYMLELLVQKKKQLEAESQAAQRQILMEFLKEARRNKREVVHNELQCIQSEIQRLTTGAVTKRAELFGRGHKSEEKVKTKSCCFLLLHKFKEMHFSPFIFTVKLWSTNLDNSVASIEAKANVCCVKFSPTSRYHLAFGCADHCVHYYDLRNTKQPIMVFKGHRKAVSYAKFVNGEEIVSASTDSQLKLWNVNKPHCLRSFKGHINEKNFVGLASNGDYVACELSILYYIGFSKNYITNLISAKLTRTQNV